MPGMSLAIAARDLRFKHADGPFALHLRDWQVEAGAAVAVVGPSGCGKTTVLDLVAGIRRGTGALTVLGTDVGALSDAGRRRFRRTRLGFVFQRFELLEYLTVRQNIALPLRLAGQREDDARVAALAAAVGLTATLDRKPAALSHGERQRAALCRALVHAPDLVLADEPTGSLDPVTAREVVGLLREQAAARGAALVMVTHDHGLLDGFDVVDARGFAA